jgi:hypothetical protein
VQFTLDEARRELALLRPDLAELIALRADLAELQADLAADERSPLGGIAEAKALEARLYAAIERISGRGVHLKGYAPVLLDFPGERDGRAVLWCWLEGDGDIIWYHRADCGFPGRRPV